jgi:signal peptidase I
MSIDAPSQAPAPEPGLPQIAVPTPERKAGWGKAVRELIETLALTLVIFLLVRFAAPNFRIEGFSMEPDFHDGQYLFVNRLIYMLHPPERGDVIVFIPPTNTSRDYIKRVIGLPGERVEIVNGRVLIAGQELEEPYPLNPGTYSYGPVTVGTAEYFVLGDNRDNSSDSHSWGMLDAKKIIGKAWITYWPLDLVGWVPSYPYTSAPGTKNP